MALAKPGITWKGFRSPATAELAIQIDAAWMRMLPGAEPKEWWRPFISEVPLRPGAEAVALVVDMEDLGSFKRKIGPRQGKPPPKLTRKLIPRAPWYRDRYIPVDDLQYDGFNGWPDRTAAVLLAARRTPGEIFCELLFAATTTTTTIQGIPLIGTGHKCNFNDLEVMDTFDNLVTGNSASATPGTFDANGWEYAQERMMQVPGPDGVHGLDQEITYVFGGTKMRKKFDRMFKKVIVLEDSSANDAAAGVTNIHHESIEGGVIAVVSSWLDRHPWKVSNPTLDQWWSYSTTTQARAIGMIIENGGAPTIDIFDESSEYAREHEHVWLKCDMDCNGDAAFPQVICEHRGA